MDWLTIVILVVVVIGLVGMLTHMSPEDRSKASSAATVVVGSTAVYTFVWSKAITKGAYDFGAGVGNDIHNSYQDELNTMDAWASKAKENGIANVARSTAHNHIDVVGVKSMTDLAREYRKSTDRK